MTVREQFDQILKAEERLHEERVGKCRAYTASGFACKNTRVYGKLCGAHYSIAEADLSRLRLDGPGRIPAGV